MKKDKTLPEERALKQIKYRNSIVEKDRRFIKRLVRTGLGSDSFNTARRILKGCETMNMIRKVKFIG